MEFGLRKCAKVTFIRTHLTLRSDMKLDKSTSVREFDHKERNKHLGIDTRDGVKHAKMKEKIKKSALSKSVRQKNQKV